MGTVCDRRRMRFGIGRFWRRPGCVRRAGFHRRRSEDARELGSEYSELPIFPKFPTFLCAGNFGKFGVRCSVFGVRGSVISKAVGGRNVNQGSLTARNERMAALPTPTSNVIVTYVYFFGLAHIPRLAALALSRNGRTLGLALGGG